MTKTKNNLGFSLIELLLVISFISVMVVLILSTGQVNNRLRKLNEERTQALFYAYEALEATKLFSWDELVAGTYYIELSGNKWTINSGSQLLDNVFTRSIEIEDVYRESSTNNHVYGEIVTSGGYLDPDTKKVTASISWNSKSGTTQEENIETYLHRFGAERWRQTDWEGGSGQETWSDDTMFSFKTSGVDVSIPGVATLQAGFIDWNFANTTSTFDTPGNFDDNDVVERNGLAYLVTEDNNNPLPNNCEFYILDVSDITNPNQISCINIGSSVTSVAVQGNYAFISTASNDAEFQVIDISNPFYPFVAATYGLDGNDDALDLDINETEAYIVQGPNLYSFSITDPTDPQPLDQISVDDEAIGVFLSEDNLYIATQDYDKELQIMDVTNPANLSPAGQFDLPGLLKGTDVFVRGSRAFISTQNNGGGDEFFAVDVSDPTSPSFLGSYGANETIHSFTIVGPYALIGTNLLNQELLVIDVSYPATMTYVSGFDLDGYVLGMSANCSVIYAATSGNSGEFFIISTEVTDCDYADNGTLESSTYDTGSDSVIYNWIAWDGTEPAETDIYFQIATSDSPSGPWNYVGPDGSSSTYFDTAAQEFIDYYYHQDERYIRYKLYMTNSSAWQVPILEEVTISYSTYP